MAKISTHQLMDEYFSQYPDPRSYQGRMRGKIDDSQLYAYEQAIGKEFADMNAQEIYDMLLSRADRRGNPLTHTMVVDYSGVYKDIYRYYIANYEPDKRLPWDSSAMLTRESLANAALRRGMKLSNELVEDAIAKMRRHYIERSGDEGIPRADFNECVTRLFLCGFATPGEITGMKEKDIDFRRNRVHVGDRYVTLDKRTMGLLKTVHSMEIMPRVRGSYDMIPYQDGYFRFPFGGGSNFDERGPNQPGLILSSALRTLGTFDGKYISNRSLFLLGFYNYMIKRCGKEKANKLLEYEDRWAPADELIQLATEYGINEEPMRIKRNMHACLDLGTDE